MQDENMLHAQQLPDSEPRTLLQCGTRGPTTPPCQLEYGQSSSPEKKLSNFKPLAVYATLRHSVFRRPPGSPLRLCVKSA